MKIKYKYKKYNLKRELKQETDIDLSHVKITNYNIIDDINGVYNKEDDDQSDDEFESDENEKTK